MYPPVDMKPVNYISVSINSEIRKTVPHPAWRISSSTLGIQDAISLVGDFGTLRGGWDGYGARPISDKVIQNTISTLTELASVREMPAPGISPEVMGTISMAWKSYSGEAYLEIGETRYSGYIEMESGEAIYLQGDAAGTKSPALLTIYERLFSIGQASSTFMYKVDADFGAQMASSLLST
jgi:hypothetical protein